MPRDLNLNVLDGIDQKTVHLAVIGEFDFTSGFQRLWAGPEGHQLNWDGKVWTALGDLGPFDKITEGQGLADSRTRVSLRIDSAIVDTIEVEDSRGRTATVILLVLSDQGTPLGPIKFRMIMGGVEIETAESVDQEGRKRIDERLTMDLLNETATLNNSHFVRMTYEAGQRVDATDHGLEFVADKDVGNLGLDAQRPGRAPGEPGGRPLGPRERFH